MLKKFKGADKGKNTDLKKNSFIAEMKLSALKVNKITCTTQNFKMTNQVLKSEKLKKNLKERK